MLRVCFVASEFAPFAKTGGLADVVAGLSAFLHRTGQDVRVFLPRYDTLSAPASRIQPVDFLSDVGIDFGGRRIRCAIDALTLETGQTIHLVRCPEMYHRGGLYRDDGDEHLRFALLCRAAIEACQRMGWGPDVFHVHDWHAGLVPVYLKSVYAWDRLFERSRTLLTIHNLAYQGWFPARVVDELGLDAHRGMLHQDDLQRGALSFLKTGLIWSDWLSTVSRTYAHEIRTPDHGLGLDGMLRERADHLSGIVNGVDYGDWDPLHDPLIPAPFSADDLAGKDICRDKLLEAMGLEPCPNGTVLGIVTRLTAQKGLDLAFEALPEALAQRDVRVCALGSGESRYEEFLSSLQRRFPGRACHFRGYQNKLAHLIEAGADVFLMPSRFEPCGLNQLYSLRYGTVPVVRRTGGLADTVEPIDPSSGRGTGVVFEHTDAVGFRWALNAAIDLHQKHPELWRRVMRNGMQQDWSWDRQGREYIALYARLQRGA